MAMPKKPIELLKQSGSYRPSTHGVHHPEPSKPNKTPDPPSRLNRYAREEWRRIVKELENLDLLRTLDLGALSLLCEQYGRALEIDLTIRQEYGSWGKYLKKISYQNDIQRKAYDTALEFYYKHLGKFGISPAERSRIKLSDSETKEAKKILEFKPS
jgi:P27 family predicted phage terminase small subunit